MIAVLKAAGWMLVAFVAFVAWYFLWPAVKVTWKYYRTPRKQVPARPPIALMLALIMLAGAAHAADLTLYWDASPSTNVAGYKLYWGTASRVYTSTQDCGNALEATVTGIGMEENTYFAVTAYKASGSESDYSEENMWDVVDFMLKPVPPGKPSFRDVIKAWFKRWFNI